MSTSVKAKPAFFDARKLPSPSNRYVCWLDLVGAANAMQLSLPRAANFIAKIHVAGQRALVGKTRLRAYPAIDGVYAVSETRREMEAFLREAMMILSLTFLKEGDHKLRFSVRCGVAFGHVIEGSDLSRGSPDLHSNPNYSQCLAVGRAIAHAYESEGQAPFFGVCIHESARQLAPPGEVAFPDRLWRWIQSSDVRHQTSLGDGLREYFDWVGKNAEAVLFPADKLPKYRKQVEEYFA